ncbi:MAG: hypothetical protein NZ828_10870 [Alphaproteobacteria bacterium]|nr:hypothetical protein [Alphaproteobacteria bacterium]MCS5597745.1 hypothetical protein [Alphaproteobacteria bacterium]|tara:strand:- start:399 stop:638 length:240 start_codon:yes stop_codon:yes gene_type:complete
MNDMTNLMPTKISGISHPAIADMYLKTSFDQKAEDVLIVETNGGKDDVDPYILDLILDLETLKEQVRRKVGHFDRVDIR